MTDFRIIASHPVQYHVPIFQALVERGLNIEVGYYHEGTARTVGRDLNFGLDIQWDIDLLGGYPNRIFLNKTATYTLHEQLQIIFPMVLWVLRERSPVLLMGWFIESIWLIWILVLLFRIPVMVLSETTPLSYDSVSKPKWRARLLGWLLNYSQAMLYIGSQNRDFLSRMGIDKNRLFSAPYSVDNLRFSSAAKSLMLERLELSSQFGLDAMIPTFLFAGKLISKKRPLELLEAYCSAGLSDKAQLLFVGDGILKAQLEKRVKELRLNHVHFLGFLNQSKMPLAYVLGDVLCLISDSTETWGLVVNEAMACGRPVIVSEMVGCAPDLVDETNGWVVPTDDPDALAQTLRQAYEERHNWDEKGQRSLEKISRHTYDAMAIGVLSALNSLKTG